MSTKWDRSISVFVALILLVQLLINGSHYAKAQFMLSRIHTPKQQQEEHSERLLKEIMDLEMPVYGHDKQRLRLIGSGIDQGRLNKVRRASKNSWAQDCNSEEKSPQGRAACLKLDKSSSSTIETDQRKNALYDIKRVIRRIERMLDQMILLGYID